VRYIGKHLGEAIEYLHANGTVHGDIKPLNLVRLGERWKLIDFDAACKLKAGAKAGAKYSSAYLPPEMLVKREKGELCVRSAQVKDMDVTKLKDPAVSLDCESAFCVFCRCILVSFWSANRDCKSIETWARLTVNAVLGWGSDGDRHDEYGHDAQYYCTATDDTVALQQMILLHCNR
jgi:serine/threonine protein kinase